MQEESLVCCLDFRAKRVQLWVVKRQKIKTMRLTTALLIVPALMGFGCASLSPSASNSPALQPELEQEQISKKAEPENNVGLEIFYCLLSIGGQTLANK
jgi:hypothetical protein